MTLLRGPVLYRHFESIICENAIVKYTSRDTRRTVSRSSGRSSTSIKLPPLTGARDAVTHGVRIIKCHGPIFINYIILIASTEERERRNTSETIEGDGRERERTREMDDYRDGRDKTSPPPSARGYPSRRAADMINHRIRIEVSGFGDKERKRERGKMRRNEFRGKTAKPREDRTGEKRT